MNKFVCIVFFVFVALFSYAQQNPVKRGVTNKEYAEQCKADGWDVDLLNTGANAEFLTDEEKNMILATNMVRTNPPKFAELYVKEVAGFFQGRNLVYPTEMPVITKEGKSAAVQLYKELQKTKPVGILFPSHGMSAASRKHAYDQAKSGKVGHGRRNETNKRLSEFGTWQVCMGENIAYGFESGHRALIALLIDDGVRSRGHRKNILKKEYNRIGVGSAAHKKYRWSFVVTYACDYVEKYPL